MPADLAARRFAALGDPQRLALLEAIASAEQASISTLSEGRNISRQAVTKHLTVLEGAGLIRGTRRAREHLWSLDAEGLAELEAELLARTARWRQRLARLKLLVEDD